MVCVKHGRNRASPYEGSTLMNTSMLEAAPVRQGRIAESRSDGVDAQWRPIYWAGGVAALLTVATVVVAIPVFIVSPPPTSVADWFALLHGNALLGLIDLDLAMLLGIGLSGLVYVALFGALRRVNAPVIALGMIVGLVGVATYFASNVAFNMLLLSNQYASGLLLADLRDRVLGHRPGDERLCCLSWRRHHGRADRA